MWSVVSSGTALTRQHFFQVVCGSPGGLLDAENFGKLFLSFFAEQRTRISRIYTDWIGPKPHGIGVIRVSGFRDGNNAVTILHLPQKPIPAGCGILAGGENHR